MPEVFKTGAVHRFPSGERLRAPAVQVQGVRGSLDDGGVQDRGVTGYETGSWQGQTVAAIVAERCDARCGGEADGDPESQREMRPWYEQLAIFLVLAVFVFAVSVATAIFFLPSLFVRRA
jgi:hypothetical protein